MSDENIPDVRGPEAFGFGNKSEGFSHEQLVMKAYNRVLECLAKQMKQGGNEQCYINGKLVVVYAEDTRETAIEAIITLKNCMIADLQNTNYLKEINNILVSINNIRKTYLKYEWDCWTAWPIRTQEAYVKAYNMQPTPGFFNVGFKYGEGFILDSVRLHRMIFEQLELCLNDKKYYRKTKVSNLAEDDADGSEGNL